MSVQPNDPPTPGQLIDNMEGMSGTHPGYRRSSARGVCFRGTFTPTGDAAGLTTAVHFQSRPVPATVRFSNSEGNPNTPDASPVTRGMATRFVLPGGAATDLLGITVPRFVASTPQEFFALTAALRANPVTKEPDPAAVQAFLAAHPHLAEALAQLPPVPVSYGTAAYWPIHTFIWVNEAGDRQPVRYRWEPVAGRADLSSEEAAACAADYLTTELHQRILDGPVAFQLHAQLGEEGDPSHDPTVVWPSHRKEVLVGRLELTEPVADQDHWAAQWFDPTWLTAGIEMSDDPVLAYRALAYAESVRRRSRLQ